MHSPGFHGSSTHISFMRVGSDNWRPFALAVEKPALPDLLPVPHEPIYCLSLTSQCIWARGKATWETFEEQVSWSACKAARFNMSWGADGADGCCVGRRLLGSELGKRGSGARDDGAAAGEDTQDSSGTPLRRSRRSHSGSETWLLTLYWGYSTARWVMAGAVDLLLRTGLDRHYLHYKWCTSDFVMQLIFCM